MRLIRTLALLALVGLVGAPSVRAQTSARTDYQSKSLTSATCTSPSSSGCLIFSVAGMGGVGVQIDGTFTGTITFYGTVQAPTDAGSWSSVVWTTVNATPPDSTTAVTSTTSTGTWQLAVGGLNYVRIKFSAYTSGTAAVTARTAPTLARGGGVGATIGGSIASTQVAFGSGANTIAGASSLRWAIPGSSSTQALIVGNDTLPTGVGGSDGTSLVVASSNTAWPVYISGPTSAGAYSYPTPALAFVSFRGTSSVPTTVVDGDDIGSVDLFPYDGSNWNNAPVVFRATVDGTPPGGDTVPLKLTLLTNRPGYYANAIVLRANGNVQFPNRVDTYTEPPVDYERVEIKWNSTVAEIGTVSGGTGTLRDLKLLGANIQVSADAIVANGKAIQGDTTSGDTYLFQVYDNNTGPAYVAWMTATNGNTPSVVIAPPTGGTTISVSARHIATGATPAVSDTSANSCGTGTETIAGTDNAGKVTVIGSAGTSCTVTFATAFTNAPACAASNETSANLARATSTTTTVVLAGTFAQNDVIAYNCMGR